MVGLYGVTRKRRRSAGVAARRRRWCDVRVRGSGLRETAFPDGLHELKVAPVGLGLDDSGAIFQITRRSVHSRIGVLYAAW